MKKDDLQGQETDFQEEKVRSLFRELQTDMRLELNREVLDYIHHFTTGQRANFEIALSLRQYYSEIIREQLEGMDMPAELEYLPIVLSGMHNQAVAPDGGTGIWKMNYFVARKYGLKVTDHIDERKDPVKSTRAALKYLSDLHERYKSWNMAITAFAFSPAVVNKAVIRSGGAINYWQVARHLRQEEMNVIPAFFASVYVSEFFIEHHLNPPGIIVNTDTKPLEIKQAVSLRLLSEQLGISEQKLRMINPTWRGEYIVPAGEAGMVFLVPSEKEEQVLAMVDDLYRETEEISKPIVVKPVYTPVKPVIPANKKKVVYTVQSGDYLGKIAEYHGVGVSQVRRWNAMRSDRIDIGQQLAIYVDEDWQANPPALESKSKAKAVAIDPSQLKEYTIREGDTLWEIARENPGNSIEIIQQINGIRNDIKPGQIIKILKSED